MADLNETLPAFNPNEIFPVLQEMLSEVQEILPRPVGRAVIVPGTAPAWDDCCQGQLAIRIASIVVTNPTPKPVGCNHGGYTYTVGISVQRCAAVLNDNGTPPSPTEITRDAFVMTDDMAALMHYLECSDKVFRMLNWVPQGPTGGCHGGEWLFTVFQPALGCCA